MEQIVWSLMAIGSAVAEKGKTMDKTEKKLVIAMGLATVSMWITIIRLLVEIIWG